MKPRLGHWMINRINYFQAKKFNNSLNRLEETQREKLSEICNYLGYDKLTYENFTNAFSESSYKDQSKWVEEQRISGTGKCPEIVRFQPTSGSTQEIKWIPYSKLMLKEFDTAASAWMFDLWINFPDAFKGHHYWSLSWLPKDFRKMGMIVDDTELFPWWKKSLLHSTMAINKRVDLTPSSESSLFSTIVYLTQCKDLSFMSVWSPSFLLNLLNEIREKWDHVIKSLKFGKWTLYKDELKLLKCPYDPSRAIELQKIKSIDPNKIWPILSLISCWDTGSSFKLAESLKGQFPKISVQGKGLWTTEGVITFPYKNNHVLAINSHFYEFIEESTGKIFASWELLKGQIVEPLLTTPNGFLRYKLGDRLLVNEFIGETPCFEFIGRKGTIDLVGEKISRSFVEDLLQKSSDVQLVCAVERQKGASFYVSLTSKKTGFNLEKELSRLFHYRVARELGELDEAKVLNVSEPWKKYLSLFQKRGKILGNIKFEPLIKISEREYLEFFYNENRFLERARPELNQ